MCPAVYNEYVRFLKEKRSVTANEIEELTEAIDTHEGLPFESEYLDYLKEELKASKVELRLLDIELNSPTVTFD